MPSLVRSHGPRTLGAIMEEYLSMTAAQGRGSGEETGGVLDTVLDTLPPPVPWNHWNHEVHARGAAFGFNAIPFTSRAER